MVENETSYSINKAQCDKYVVPGFARLVCVHACLRGVVSVNHSIYFSLNVHLEEKLAWSAKCMVQRAKRRICVYLWKLCLTRVWKTWCGNTHCVLVQ